MHRVFNGIYRDRKVLITGHTGFKGSWLSLLLHKLGADVYGYALEPLTTPSLFREAKIEGLITSYIGDICDYDNLLEVLKQVEPEIVIHMAAQSLVRESYKAPVETYSVNVMGSVHLLEACRYVSSVKAIVNVTTDKCYENREWYWGYRENEPMGGNDPYSSSKGCSELVTSTYRNSYFNPKEYDKHGVALASARAGNAIGGGDWANDRLVPDFIRAVSSQEKVKIRYPHAVRPWQHVLEPLAGYLKLASMLYVEGCKYSGGWNFGPDESDVRSVKWVVQNICDLWGNDASFEVDTLHQSIYEANHLKLDCSKAKTELNWTPKWSIKSALRNVVEWNKAFSNGENAREVTLAQITQYFS